MKETLEDIACGAVFILIVAAIFWAILSIPAGAQTSQADSIFGALNAENIVRDSSHVVETIKGWDASKWEIIAVPDTGDMVFYQDAPSPLAWITDSITWIAIDTTFAGNLKCEHDWVLDTTRPGNVDIHLSFGLEIMDCTKLNPDGKHCNEHQSATREKICRKCLFSVLERENRFQHFVVPPKTEFEILKERQRNKQ